MRGLRFHNRQAMSTATHQPSAWSPLRYSLFRALWVASVVSNLGTWMEEVGEAWLMTDQTAFPLLRVAGAVRAGLRCVRHAPALPVVLGHELIRFSEVKGHCT